MKTISLVTDSTCDLPDSLLQACNIHVVPINIQFGPESYQDNITISTAEFYTKVAQSGFFPQTSQPSVRQFTQVYQALSPTASDIISLHVTAQLSGTHQSAVLAAAQVANSVKVHVVDSMAGSAGMGWMLQHAHQLIEQGHSASDIVARLEANRPRISVFFAVDNLEFAQRSGRVNKLTSVLVSLLNIKPIIGLENGLIEVKDRARSSKAALKRIVDLTFAQTGNNPVQVGIVHAQAPQRAVDLYALAQSRLNIQQYFIRDVALSLAVHFGPGTVGLVTYPQEAENVE